MLRIVCFGPGPQFKGGIANYNTSLARAFDKIDSNEVHIVSWTQQYPAIIPRDFIDRKSKKDQLDGTRIKVHYLTNYNNPRSWESTVKLISALVPDIVIFQWAIAIQGVPMGYIAQRLKKKGIHVVFDLHFVNQKEGSSIDKHLTKWGIKHARSYVVHATQTAEELKTLFPERAFKLVEDGSDKTEKTKIVKLYHPVYDMFKPDPSFDKEAVKAAMGLKKHVFLFFGFIRKYKGLHLAIEAFNKLQQNHDDVSLLIVGESFWQTLDNKKLATKVKNKLFGLAKSIFLKKQDDERNYNPLNLITQYELEKSVVVVNDFVPNEDVHKYFQVSDNLVLFYLNATPSGVESIGYNFNIPMLASAVGHFPETIQDGYNGYLANPNDIEDMALVMEKAISKPIQRENIGKTSREMSWENYAKAISHLLNN
ncbi:MAG: glycosyltransferase [Bacteroidales bacterium]|nr:glycosyltransferase [Bacteroidales bacterium]